MKQILIIGLITMIASPVLSQQKNQSNKHFSNTMETTAKAESIWSIWTDVNGWKNWDTGLENATMKDSFGLGAVGTITSLEGRKSKFKVVAFEANKSYTFKTKLPLSALYVKRTLRVENDITYFTHEVWFKGLTSGMFAKKFGPKFREMLPRVMENIKTIAE